MAASEAAAAGTETKVGRCWLTLSKHRGSRTKVREDLFSDWLKREADFSVLEGCL